MWRGLLLGLLTVALPVGLLAGFVVRAAERERRLHAEELAASYRALAAARVGAFEAALGRDLAGWIDALEQASGLAARREVHERLGIGQALVLDAHGGLVYPPPLALYGAEAWPVAHERALGAALRLEDEGRPDEALVVYARLAERAPALAPVAQFRRGLCLRGQAQLAEAAEALEDAANWDAGPLYFQLAARLEVAECRAALQDPAAAAEQAVTIIEQVLAHPERLPRRSAAGYLQGEAERLLAAAAPPSGLADRLAAVKRLQARQSEEDALRAELPALGLALAEVRSGRRALAFAPERDGGMLMARRDERLFGVRCDAATLAARFAALPPTPGATLALAQPHELVTTGPTVDIGLLGPGYAVVSAPIDPAGAALALRQRLFSQLALIGLAVLLAGSGGVFLLRAYWRAAEASRAKSAFIARISHELKTPLALIHGVAETLYLGRVADPDKARRYLQTLLRESEALARLVQSVLDFAAGEQGRLAGAAVEVDLCELTAEVCESIGAYGEACGQVTLVRMLPAVPLRLRVDPEGARLALLNLLVNAVKYSPDGGEIEVGLVALAGRARVEVSDRGAGVTAEESARIFLPFVRGQAARPGVRGAGLGLALVREVARRHGGEISVAPRPGGGSRFVLELGPLVEPPA